MDGIRLLNSKACNILTHYYTNTCSLQCNKSFNRKYPQLHYRTRKINISKFLLKNELHDE